MLLRRRASQRSETGGQRPRAAFEAEALSYLDSLYGAALRLTRSRVDADDLVQDTFVKAFRFAGQFQPGTNLKAWLFTILHNTHLNRLRQLGRDPIAVDSEAVDRAVWSDRTETPEAILIRKTLDADLQAALDALPHVFRQAVWLRDVDEFSYADIARILDVPIGTVMSRISRGRRMLYTHLMARRADLENPLAAEHEQLR